MGDVKLFAVLLGLSVPAYILIWRTFFGDWDDFTDALYYFFSPRWLDWLRGELVEDSWAHVKLLAFAGLSLAVAWGEYVALRNSLPGLAHWLASLV